MSRSGYHDDGDNWSLIRWRGAVNSAIRGARGQAFLREVLAALDAMPVKELAADSLVSATGQYCTLGSVGAARGLDMSGIDAHDPEQVAQAFGIAEALAREVVFLNDEAGIYDDREMREVEVVGPLRHFDRRIETVWFDDVAAARRWRRMRAWVVEQIRSPELVAHV